MAPYTSMLKKSSLHLVTVLLCLHCSSSPSTPDESTLFNKINIALATEPPTLDWNLATDGVSYQVLNQLMEGLTQYDENLHPIPAVAKSWDVSKDGKTYTFYLDPKYKWSDGRVVTAHDFYASWIRLLQPNTAAEYAYFLFDIAGAKEFNSGNLTDVNKVGLRVVDDTTFEVRLKNPVVFFPAITTFMVTYPLRQDILEKFGDHWTDPQHMLTCGPFTLKEWWHEYRLQLEPNPFYGGTPQPKIKNLTIYLVREPLTALSLFEQKHLDMVVLPPMAINRYKNHPDALFHTQLRGTYYGFNIHKKPFDDVRVRQAMALALDKSPLPQILKGHEETTNSWIPPGMFGHNNSMGLQFDPQKARELLKQAGYDDTKKIPDVELTFNSDPTNKKIAEWAGAQWKKNLGLSVKLKQQEWKAYLALLKTNPPSLFRLGWGADYPDPDNFMNLFASWSGNNHTEWKNQEYDLLIREGAIERNPESRLTIYNQAQKMLLENHTVIVPLYVSTQNLLVAKKLQPFPVTKLDVVYYKKVGNP